MSSLKIDMALAFLLAAGVLALLPESPFTYFTETIGNVDGLVNLSYVNWFIPFGQIIAVGQAWLSCIAIYYCYEYVMRFIKLIS